MLTELKAEFRKIFTVRSTYVILFLALALNGLVAGYGHGYKMTAEQAADPTQLVQGMQIAVSVTAVFVSVIAALLITYEYRYNTILYALAVKRRSTFMMAKFIAVVLLAASFTVAMALLAALFSWIGARIAGHSFGAQSFYYGDFVWRFLFYGIGSGLIALLIGFLIRNQVGTIMTMFILPSTAEPLLGLLLKSKAAYLPFTAVNAVIQQNTDLSYGKAAAVFGAYMAIGWAAAWILFMRRDAS